MARKKALTPLISLLVFLCAGCAGSLSGEKNIVASEGAVRRASDTLVRRVVGDEVFKLGFDVSGGWNARSNGYLFTYRYSFDRDDRPTVVIKTHVSRSGEASLRHPFSWRGPHDFGENGVRGYFRKNPLDAFAAVKESDIGNPLAPWSVELGWDWEEDTLAWKVAQPVPNGADSYYDTALVDPRTGLIMKRYRNVLGFRN